MKCTRTGVNWKYLTCERGQINIFVEEFEACLDTELNPDHSSPHNEKKWCECTERKVTCPFNLRTHTNPVIKRLPLQDKGRDENGRTEKREVQLTPSLTITHRKRRRLRAMSQRSGFRGLCCLYGWLEVTAWVSQLTGPRSDWDQLNF